MTAAMEPSPASSPDTEILKVPLGRPFHADAAHQAQLHSRDIAEQVAHWACLGQAVEQDPVAALGYLNKLAAGVLRLVDLPEALQPLGWALIRQQWEEPSPKRNAFAEAMLARRKEVGLPPEPPTDGVFMEPQPQGAAAG